MLNADDQGVNFFGNSVTFQTVKASLSEVIDSTGGNGCTPSKPSNCLVSTTLGYPSGFSLGLGFSGTNTTFPAPTGQQFSFSASYFESRTPAIAIWSVGATTSDMRGLTGVDAGLQTASLNTDYLNVPEVGGSTAYTAGAPAGTPQSVPGCPNGPFATTQSTGDLSAPVSVTFNGVGTFANNPQSEAGQNMASLTQTAPSSSSSSQVRTLQRFARSSGVRFLPRSMQRTLRGLGFTR
jgi:hypothetical protein